MNKDALDLLREFFAHKVRFLLIGAHAVSFYAIPRATGDLDLLVEPTPENAERTFAALRRFGAPLTDLSVSDLSTPGTVFQMGIAPHRIDVMTKISGVDFDEAWRGHSMVRIEELEIPVISVSALFKNKKATGRGRDQIDLESLRTHLGEDPEDCG